MQNTDLAKNKDATDLGMRELERRKTISRSYIRSLPPSEKVKLLMQLQEQTWEFLKIREQNGGKPVPERWRKWHRARREYADSLKR